MKKSGLGELGKKIIGLFRKKKGLPTGRMEPVYMAFGILRLTTIPQVLNSSSNERKKPS